MNELQRFQKYFSLKEIVSKKVYEKYGEQAWSFFDPRLLSVVAWLRESMGIPLVCNNWHSGGTLDSRGFRDNLDEFILRANKQNRLYCTAHSRGQGIDLSSGDATAVQIRKWIRTNIQSCPYPIRLENDKSAPTWVHIDVCNITGKILQEFNA